MLDDLPVRFVNPELGMQRAAPLAELEQPVLLDSPEYLGLRIGFAMIVTEADADKHDQAAAVARAPDRLGGARNDAALLHLQAQGRCAARPVAADQIVLHVENKIGTFHFRLLSKKV